MKDPLGKFTLNHPIVMVAGTVALLFSAFRSVATALEPGAEALLVLVQPSWRYFFAFALMIYGGFLAFQFHRVVKKKRHEVIGVSYAFSISLTGLGWAFGIVYYMPSVATIGFLATLLTLPLVVWLAVRSKAAREPAQ